MARLPEKNRGDVGNPGEGSRVHWMAGEESVKRLACLLVLGWLGASGVGRGQELPPDSGATPQTSAPQAAAADPMRPSEQVPVLDPTAPAETDITLGLRTQVRAGIGFSGPLGAMGSVQIIHGLSTDVREEGTRVKAVCGVPIPHCAQGFLLRADAGSGGGRLSLGLGAWAKVDTDDFKGNAGVALRLAVAHTWGDPIGQPAGLTYLGPELDLSVLRINLTLGVLFRVRGDGGSSALFSWGLGFGL